MRLKKSSEIKTLFGLRNPKLFFKLNKRFYIYLINFVQTIIYIFKKKSSRSHENIDFFL